MIPGVNQFGKFLGAVGNRASSVAREARDIPTAIGTAVSTKNPNYLRDVPTQINEVSSAAKGYKGTSAFVKGSNPKLGSDWVTKTDRGAYSEGNTVSIGKGYTGKLPRTP
jgi:hypothetical protein